VAAQHKVYRFRMEPTKTHAVFLGRMAGARRFIWNWALRRWKDYHAEHGKSISLAQLSAELTALKQQPETAWLNEIDSQALQQALKGLYGAFVNFFEKRARHPRFKSRKRDRARFRIPQRVKIQDGKVSVPKVGQVRIRQSQPVEGTTKSATFRRDARGHWFVTLTVCFELPDGPLLPPAADKVAGIDLGLIDFATLSDGSDPIQGAQVLPQGPTEAAHGSESTLPPQEREQAEGQGPRQGGSHPPEDCQPEVRLPPQTDHQTCPRSRRDLHRGPERQGPCENQAGQVVLRCFNG